MLLKELGNNPLYRCTHYFSFQKWRSCYDFRVYCKYFSCWWVLKDTFSVAPGTVISSPATLCFCDSMIVYKVYRQINKKWIGNININPPPFEVINLVTPQRDVEDMKIFVKVPDWSEDLTNLDCFLRYTVQFIQKVGRGEWLL